VQAITNSEVITMVMFKLMKMQEVNVSKWIFLVVASMTLASCSQCVDCELNGSTERLCDTEFDSPDQYQNAVDDREADGATCTPVTF
jgi:hypothetical protein